MSIREHRLKKTINFVHYTYIFNCKIMVIKFIAIEKWQPGVL